MDAQNATEATATKPHASTLTSASPRSGNTTDVERTSKPQFPAPSIDKPSTASTLFKDSGSGVTASHPQVRDDEAAADAHSDAETIVLPGKDGSPVKHRKVIKHEDASDPEAQQTAAAPPTKHYLSDCRTFVHGRKDDSSMSNALATDDAKRRPLLLEQSRSKGLCGLSSAPRSPPHHSWQHSADAHPETGAEAVPAKSKKLSVKEKDPRHKDILKTKADKLVLHTRKAPRHYSDDDAGNDNHKVRHQRASASIDTSSSTPRLLQQKDRDPQKCSLPKVNYEIASSTRPRSISPQPRAHRRNVPSQVASQSSIGLHQKKKRAPPPLTTDYHSDDSSASGSLHIRSSTLRGLATPATAESIMSSTRNPAHKKHVDAHGQTQLAKACSRGEYDNVKRRLHERPQDLNFPDYAGNTPLQIAAINGFDDIVKLLVDSGCDIDCVNHDKDTPLLDAVDNGHLEVIQVLLAAGVNPRKANVNGEEPLDRVDDELENATKIRAALIEARKKMGDRRRTSEEQQDIQDPRFNDLGSPRCSPAVAELATSTRRAASSRSHKLSNHLLYMHMDDKTLRSAAGRGDVETVERILQVRDTFDDAESMVAAARGGHETVMNLLLALGNANPDPSPVDSERPEIATPILAAIGQENIRVIRLLLAQSNFDPTRKFRGQTYYEIAQKRQGPNWKEEEHLLKRAYDDYRKSHRDPFKKSPNRRESDKRGGRCESKDDSSKAAKRRPNSPARDCHSANTAKPRTCDKERREKEPRSSVNANTDDLVSQKRGPGRPRKDDRGIPTIAIPDGETSPPSAKPPNKQKRPDIDLTYFSSEGESKPRKRLLSGKDLKEQRERNRRASMVSTTSPLREPSTPRDPRHDDQHDLVTQKYHHRAKAIKRDESWDRLSISGEHSAKRSRTSATPDLGSSEKEGEPAKRRRLDADKKERLTKPSSSPDRNRKTKTFRDGSASKQDDRSARKLGEEFEKRDSLKTRKLDSVPEHIRRERGSTSLSEKSIHVKAEDPDVAMRDAEPGQDEGVKARLAREKEDEKKRRSELDTRRKEKEVEERKRREEEEIKRRQTEARRREDEQEKKRLEEERKRQEEVEKLQKAEEDRRKREEEDRRKKEEEDRRKKEEEDRRKKEEEDRRKKEEEKRRLETAKEEEERKRREEDRIRREQEAAEQARQRREEQERLEQERQERQRALREAELRKREEQEKARLEKLPAFLRWLGRSANARTPEIAKRFRVLTGVRFDSIRTQTVGTEEGRESWILNSEAALVLGESDVQLTRFPDWKRVPATEVAKHVILGKNRPSCGLIYSHEWDLGRQLSGYYFGKEPEQLSFKEQRKLQEESKLKFLAMDLFFVKLSDLMSSVPNFPHLRHLEIVVMYEELPETLHDYDEGNYPSRWKDDLDADSYMGFCPRPHFYVNGQLVRTGKVNVSTVSRTPWPEQRVPRDGLTAVSPSNPNYARLGKKQGLDHLASGLRTPPLTTDAQSSPHRLFSQRACPGQNDGLSSPHFDSTATANGDAHQSRSSISSTGEQEKPLDDRSMGPTQVSGELFKR